MSYNSINTFSIFARMNKITLHKSFVYILTIILLAYNIKTVSIIVDFKINQNTIAKTLCVQKENQKGCLGKCQLVKALKKDLQTQDEAPLQNNKNITLNINFLQPVNEINIHFLYKLKSNCNYNSLTQNNIVKHYKVRIPPPKVS